MRKTRQQELDELEASVSAQRAELRDETRPLKREALERRIAGAVEAARLINARHDRLEAEAGERERVNAVRLASVHQANEAAIRQELRSRFPLLPESEFERLYPTMRDQYLVDKALGRNVGSAVPAPPVEF